MLKTLQALGIIADESPLVGGPYAPYRQSERLAIYKKYALELVEKGKAYYCVCTSERLTEMRLKQQSEKKVPKYDRHCLNTQAEVRKMIDAGTKYVIRLLIPDKEITFTDLVRGVVTFQSSSLDDQVLLKSDGFPTYHLGVVVDDHLMKISHVLRGEEWLPSTPKHILLYDAFGWEKPQFGHVSLLRNPDKSKLSKRKNPVWASEYIERGIFPEALLNYLALMGWSHPEGKDIFTLDEYVKVFDIKNIQTTAPVFDPVKLEWINGMYMREMSVATLTKKICEYVGDTYDPAIIGKTVPLVRERLKKLSEYIPLCEFIFKKPSVFEVDLHRYSTAVMGIKSKILSIENFNAEQIGLSMSEAAKELGMKNSEFFMLLRVAMTGKKVSPPLNESMELLGKEECLNRLSGI